jgi:hypothetical protein
MPSIAHADDRVFVPLQLTSEDGILTFISPTTVFGTPVDVTVSEIALECLFPADDLTATHLRKLQSPPNGSASLDPSAETRRHDRPELRALLQGSRAAGINREA